MFSPQTLPGVHSALLHADVGPFLGALAPEWGAVSPGAVAEWPYFSPSSTPHGSFQSLGNGKLIQLLGAEQCSCAVKSGYFWIFLPPCPTQPHSSQWKDVSLETSPGTEWVCGMLLIQNSPSVPLGQLSGVSSGIQVEKGIFPQT